MQSKKSQPNEPFRLPIKLAPVSNGEYFPRPLSSQFVSFVDRVAQRLDAARRRTGLSRREFIRSSSGAATVLMALNTPGCGGSYRLPKEAEHESAAADEVLNGDELIFDVQTHHVSGERPWHETDEPNLGAFLKTTPAAECGAPHWVDCFTRDPFLKEVFLDSDTDLAVLSALWGSRDINAIHVEEADLTRQRLAQMEGSRRLRIHGIVLPKARSDRENQEHMQDLAETWQISAWKLYPVWGPHGKGYRLDDQETGMATFQRGLELGIDLFAIHKGLPLPGMDPAYTRADDVGPVARAFPEAKLLIYHSGFEPDFREGPYNHNSERGVDVLISSLQANGIGKDGNVYAELGSLWREVMRDPEQAAHVLGKLLKYLGEDRILWGTDAIWYGSPQDQIQAFRAFQISPEFQERHGYPALTEQAKAKIFGLNALGVYGVDAKEAREARNRDTVARARTEYNNRPEPSLSTYGPRTRREMLGLLRANRGLPG